MNEILEALSYLDHLKSKVNLIVCMNTFDHQNKHWLQHPNVSVIHKG